MNQLQRTESRWQIHDWKHSAHDEDARRHSTKPPKRTPAEQAARIAELRGEIWAAGQMGVALMDAGLDGDG